LLLALPLLAALPNRRCCNNVPHSNVKGTKAAKTTKAHHPLDFVIK
jgi:hypothetical protein